MKSFHLLKYAPAVALVLVSFLQCAVPMRLHRQTQSHMGTEVTITVYDYNSEQANRAIAAAFEEFRRIDDLLSHYKEESEVGRLNTTGRIENPSDDLKLNLERSLHYSRLSDGAFDITVQPILDLYDTSFRERGQAPTEEEIRNTLELVDYGGIQLQEGTATLREGQKITLGAIAKGFAIDSAAAVLKEQGIEHALVEAGGDIGAVGGKSLDQDWTIGLRNPRNTEESLALIPLRDRAVVTSGDYERYFDEEKSFHHIVDPKTGYSATELISVTVVADSAFDADAISTSVFVLGSEEGLELVNSLENVEALLVTADRTLISTPGFETLDR
jgi:thiamine biosynthesis lipoprotein